MSSQKLLRLAKKEYMTTAQGYLSDSVPIADDTKWEKSVMIHGCEQYSLYVHQSFPSPKFRVPIPSLRLKGGIFRDRVRDRV